MLQFIRICWRDLWRNTRRTVLTGLVMVFSVFLLIFATALGDGAHDKMIRAVTDSFLGHGQVQHPAWQADPSMDNRMDRATIKEARRRIASVPGITASTERISTGALLSRKMRDPDNADDMAAWQDMVSEGALLMGVDPVDEVRVTTLAKSVVPDDPDARCLSGCRTVRREFGGEAAGCTGICKGAARGFDGPACAEAGQAVCAAVCESNAEGCTTNSCVARFSDYCAPAHFLAATDPWPDQPFMGEILLGTGLAKVLGVGVGDLVAASTGTVEGRTFGSIYRVAGLLRTQSQEINRTFAMTDIGKLADGLEMPGAATQIVFAVKDLDDIDAVTEQASHALAGVSGAAAKSWKQVSPEMDLFVKLDQGSMLVMLILMIMVVAVLLANVVIMAGMERTREYGVRLAMGESPARITAGLMMETFLLAVVSGLIGAAIAEALVVAYMHYPIDFGMGEMSSVGVVIDTVFHTKFTVYGLVFGISTVWFFALAGAFIPSLRIRRMKPVEAIRFV